MAISALVDRDRDVTNEVALTAACSSPPRLPPSDRLPRGPSFPARIRTSGWGRESRDRRSTRPPRRRLDVRRAAGGRPERRPIAVRRCPFAPSCLAPPPPCPQARPCRRPCL